MEIIGVTGGVGSGKSEVLAFLEKKYNACVCRLDDVAKELQKKGKPCYDRIVEKFGTDILAPDGELDRKRLAGIVFADEEKRILLNAIVHPYVKQKVKEDIAKRKTEGVRLYFIESAILPEAGYEDICLQNWYIYASEAVRRKRLAKNRGYSEDKITQMIAAQPSEKTYRDFCGAVIDNSGEFKDTIRQIGDQR